MSTPSRAAPHGPLPTHPAGTVPASPTAAGWAHTWLGRQLVLLMAGRGSCQSGPEFSASYASAASVALES